MRKMLLLKCKQGLLARYLQRNIENGTVSFKTRKLKNWVLIWETEKILKMIFFEVKNE